MPGLQEIIPAYHQSGLAGLQDGLLSTRQFSAPLQNPQDGPTFLLSSDKTGLKTNSFVRFRLQDLANPPSLGAVISLATARIMASRTDTSDMNIEISLAGYEQEVTGHGTWSTTNSTGPALSRYGDCDDMSVSSAGPTEEISTPSAGGSQGTFDIREFLIKTTQSAGQSVLATSSFTLIECAFNVGSNGGASTEDVTVQVFACAANDGSDNRPVLPLLAESDPITYDNLTPVGSPIRTVVTKETFVFSGPDQISIVSGNRYVFILVPKVSAPSPLNALILWTRVYEDLVSGYLDGELVADSPSDAGVGGAFSKNPFPLVADMPAYRNADGTVIHLPPPVGPVLVVDPMPAFTDNVNAAFNVTPLVQAWVNDPVLHALDSIGFVFSVPDPQPEVNDRLGDDADLVVSWTDPQSRLIVG